MNPVATILMSLMDDVRLGSSLPELLCRDACRRLPLRGAAIALMDHSGLVEQVAGSDDRAVVLQDLQRSLGEGPCVDAYRTGRLVLDPDLAARGGDRWPTYTAAALDAGVRAVFCYPLQIGGIRLGVLELCGHGPGMLDDDSLGLALHYVDAAVSILLHLQSLDTGHAVIAFRSHPEIHQATGMVSVQAGVSLTEALLLVRGYSFAEDRALADVARDVVSRKLSFA